MEIKRNNHYVPEWYQRGFLAENLQKLHYLNLAPDPITRSNGDPIILPNGQIKTHNCIKERAIAECFYQRDLYTTFFGDYIHDEIERTLFGEIDDTGAKAVSAYINTSLRRWHEKFEKLFSYIDSQKIRTPKGLDWIKKHYPSLG